MHLGLVLCWKSDLSPLCSFCTPGLNSVPPQLSFFKTGKVFSFSLVKGSQQSFEHMFVKLCLLKELTWSKVKRPFTKSEFWTLGQRAVLLRNTEKIQTGNYELQLNSALTTKLQLKKGK